MAIRADADAVIGAGHLMRCLALAEAWQEAGGDVVFVTRCANSALLDRLRSTGSAICCIDATANEWRAIERFRDADVLVIDGYAFDTEYQRRCRELFPVVTAIDDLARLPRYFAHVIVNQNVYASAADYAHAGDATLFLGSRWALLRSEFGSWSRWKRAIPDRTHNILVTLGGSDPCNLTGRVVRALLEAREDWDRATVIAGPANDRGDELRKLIEEAGGTIELRADVTDMPVLMARADLAITAGGSTCLEMACLGLPAVAIATSENQKPVVDGFAKARAVRSLGWHEQVTTVTIAGAVRELSRSARLRRQMAESGRKLVDAEGARRLTAELVALC